MHHHAERTKMSCGGWRMLQATEEKVEKGRQGTGGLWTWMLAYLEIAHQLPTQQLFLR
jgi:hypothetical protein